MFCVQISNLFCKQNISKYMTSILLQVVGVEHAHTLTETTALHMRAKQTCIDALGEKRWAQNGHSLYRQSYHVIVIIIVIGRNGTLPLGLFRTNFTIFIIEWDWTSAYIRRIRLPLSVHYWSHPPTRPIHGEIDHHTRNYVPYSFRQVGVIFHLIHRCYISSNFYMIFSVSHFFQKCRRWVACNLWRHRDVYTRGFWGEFYVRPPSSLYVNKND